jgi:hypothetical protein
MKSKRSWGSPLRTTSISVAVEALRRSEFQYSQLKMGLASVASLYVACLFFALLSGGGRASKCKSARRHAWILSATVAVLLCCLVGSELPELIRLVDDASNDFALLDSQEARGTVIQYQRSRISCDRITASVTMPCYRTALLSISSIPLRSTLDLLHSFCIQRT